MAVLARFNCTYSASATASPAHLSSTAILLAMRDANMACTSSVLCMPPPHNPGSVSGLSGSSTALCMACASCDGRCQHLQGHCIWIQRPIQCLRCGLVSLLAWQKLPLAGTACKTFPSGSGTIFDADKVQAVHHMSLTALPAQCLPHRAKIIFNDYCQRNQDFLSKALTLDKV